MTCSGYAATGAQCGGCIRVLALARPASLCSLPPRWCTERGEYLPRGTDEW